MGLIGARQGRAMSIAAILILLLSVVACVLSLILVLNLKTQYLEAHATVAEISHQLNRLEQSLMQRNQNAIKMDTALSNLNLEEYKSDLQQQEQITEELTGNMDALLSESAETTAASDNMVKQVVDQQPAFMEDGATRNDLTNAVDKKALTDIYEIYHKNRKDNCGGCRYVPFINHLYKWNSLFDGGAANCGLLKNLTASHPNKVLRGVEFSKWILEAYCNDLFNKGWVENAALHEIPFQSSMFDMIVSTDVLEHVPLSNVQQSLQELARIGTPGAKYLLIIASDPDQKDIKSLTMELSYKIHETVKPRSWWLGKLREAGLIEDKDAFKKFLKFNKEVVKDNSYIKNERHINRLYTMVKQG